MKVVIALPTLTEGTFSIMELFSCNVKFDLGALGIQLELIKRHP